MSNEYLDIAMKKVIKQEVNAVLEQIRAEIEQKYNDYKMRDDYEEAYGLEEALMVIDRHMKG